MAVVQPQQFSVESANRLVWVLNRDPLRDYKEQYKDIEVIIPANQKKIFGLVNEGGNLMPWISARRFLGQAVQVSEKTPHGEIVNMGKPLYTLELTDEERNEFQDQSEKELIAAVKEEEKSAENTCMLCKDPKTFATKKGLELHVKKEHGNRKPIEE